MEHTRADVQVRRNDELDRYELRVGGELAGIADFVQEGGAVALTHTVVEPRFRHQGWSSQLAQYAVEDIAGQGRRIKPYCSYMARYLEKHPAYSHLVSWPQEP